MKMIDRFMSSLAALMCVAAIATFFVASAVSSARNVERTMSSARYIAALEAQAKRNESARMMFVFSHEQ